MSRSLWLHDAADLEFPDAAPSVAPGVRMLVLAKFPFSLVYSVRMDVIRVLAVAHQRKRPYYWHGQR